MQKHQELVDILSRSDFGDRYLDLCSSYAKQHSLIDAPRLDMVRTAEIFKAHDATARWNKAWKMFEFGRAEIGGWVWTGSLVVQRYDALEPMLKGLSGDKSQSAGSTFLDLAIDAGDRCVPPTPRSRFMPPIPNRPRFDGDMRTMERMVPDLIKLFCFVKDIVRAGWPATPAFEHED